MPETIAPDVSGFGPVEITQALVRCQSVTPSEGGALSYLEAKLERLGFACHRMTFKEPGTPDVDNLYARYGTASPNLCFAGHTDVVPPGNLSHWSAPPFEAKVASDHIIGRGAVDMKGGIACFLAGVAQFLNSPAPGFGGSISFLITGDEEGPSINGTTKVLDWLKARGEKLDACIVGEPSNPKALGDAIKIGRRGSLRAELKVAGKQGHSAYPQLADNPVPKLIHILDHLSRLKLDGGTPDFEPTNLQVTVIDVPNAAVNVIPATARAEFGIRYNTTWTRATLEAHLRAAVAMAAKSAGATPENQVSLSFSGTGDVFLTKAGPLTDHMRKAVAEITGRTPELSTGGGTSDARFIQAYCPVIEFGLVNATIHQVDERVAIKDLHELTRIYQSFLNHYFS